jgi:nucleoside phosphorylase/tetratricopeptide (TPR) repeat protein
MTLSVSPIWMVPRRRDPAFVGRDDELASIKRALLPIGDSALSQPLAIHGLGGVGKTLLVIEFAYRNASDYDAVLWLAAESPTSLTSVYADMTGVLNLPEASESNQATRIKAVQSWLDTHIRWLLVFDNAERREDLEPYVPTCVKGHILITSRNPDWHPLAGEIKIDPLPRADSIKLLKSHQGLGDSSEADRLAEALGDLPLALAQAAAFIRETGRSFADYLDRLMSHRTGFDRGEEPEPGYGRTVAATLALAIDRLGERGEGRSPAEVLLARCAFLAPDEIPRDLLSGEVADEATLDEAVRTLRRYSLVDSGEGVISVHRLVQRSVRERMSRGEQDAQAGHAVQKVGARFPRDPSDVRTWPECRRLLDHALFTAATAHAAGVSLGATAALLSNAGAYFYELHDLSKATASHEQALHILESGRDQSPASMAWTLVRLGKDLLLRGEMEAAQQRLERALAILSQTCAADCPEVADALTNLGNVARRRGNLSEARSHQERALRIFESAYGPNSREVALTLHNLGLVARHQENLPEAQQCHERSIQIFDSVYGPDHPDTALFLTDLGVVLRDEGRLPEAKAGLERALRVFKSSYGPTHPEVAITLTHLSLVLKDLGELSESQRCLTRALAIEESAYGTEHPEYARTMMVMGEVLLQAGNLARAKGMVQPAAAILGRILEEKHPTTLRAHQLLEQIRAGQTVRPPATGNLDEEIRSILRPLMGDRDSRRARLARAFADYHGLLDRINLDGETGVFLSHLLQTLRDYGDLEPGSPAVGVLLESIKTEVGAGDRARIDQILQSLEPTAAAASANLRTPQREIVTKEEIGRKPMTHGAQSMPIPSNRGTDFLILTPLQEERDAVLRCVGSYRKLPPSEHDIRVYYESDLAATFSDGSTTIYRVVVTPLLGMGRVEAANATGDAIRRWRPRYILLVGIAGGLAKAGVALGDVLISDQIVDYELQKLTTDKTTIRWQVHRVDPRLLGAAQNVIGDEWQQLLEQERPGGRGKPKQVFGPICTGDKVIANGPIEEYREVWSKLIGVEMEAGGTASAAFQAASTPGFLMICGVSDLADGAKDSAGVMNWREYACDVAATYAVALLRSGPMPQSPGIGDPSRPSDSALKLIKTFDLAAEVAKDLAKLPKDRSVDQTELTSITSRMFQRPAFRSNPDRHYGYALYAIILTRIVWDQEVMPRLGDVQGGEEVGNRLMRLEDFMAKECRLDLRQLTRFTDEKISDKRSFVGELPHIPEPGNLDLEERRKGLLASLRSALQTCGVTAPVGDWDKYAEPDQT